MSDSEAGDSGQYRCSECNQQFSSLDNLVDHTGEHHPNLNQLTIWLDEKPDTRERNPLETAMENSEGTESLINTLFDRWEKMQEGGRVHQRRLTIVAGILFLSVLISSTYLTHQGVLNDSAYTLLLGTLVGYMLTFLEDYL